MEKKFKVTKVREGWYKVTIVSIDEWLDSIHNGPKKETHYLDIVRTSVWRGIPTWEVTSRIDSVERKPHDRKWGERLSLKSAKEYAQAVAAHIVHGVPAPDRWKY